MQSWNNSEECCVVPLAPENSPANEFEHRGELHLVALICNVAWPDAIFNHVPCEPRSIAAYWMRIAKLPFQGKPIAHFPVIKQRGRDGVVVGSQSLAGTTRRKGRNKLEREVLLL